MMSSLMSCKVTAVLYATKMINTESWARVAKGKPAEWVDFDRTADVEALKREKKNISADVGCALQLYRAGMVFACSDANAACMHQCVSAAATGHPAHMLILSSIGICSSWRCKRNLSAAALKEASTSSSLPEPIWVASPSLSDVDGACKGAHAWYSL